MTELQLLVTAAAADLGTGPLVLADVLQEAGREREAVLLRKRWKLWRKRHGEIDSMRERAHGLHATEEQVAPLRAYTDRGLVAYTRERFGTQVLDVKRWFRHYGIDHAVPVAEAVGGTLRACCGLLAYEGELVGVFGRRICRQCRKNLTGAAG